MRAQMYDAAYGQPLHHQCCGLLCEAAALITSPDHPGKARCRANARADDCRLHETNRHPGFAFTDHPVEPCFFIRRRSLGLSRESCSKLRSIWWFAADVLIQRDVAQDRSELDGVLGRERLEGQPRRLNSAGTQRRARCTGSVFANPRCCFVFVRDPRQYLRRYFRAASSCQIHDHAEKPHRPSRHLLAQRSSPIGPGTAARVD